MPLARQPAASGFNASLHGARGFLALAVFVFHVACSGVPTFSLQQSGLLHAALISLQFGVEIFFCISGFIVVGALRRSPDAGSFLADRAIRILPVLWATLAVIIPLGILTHQNLFLGHTLRDMIWIVPFNLAALAGMVPVPVLHMAAWSLSYELTFYMVAASLCSLPASRPIARGMVIALALGLIIWHPRAVFFAVGVLVARTDLDRHPIARYATRAPGLMLGGFLACWYVVQFAAGANGEASAVEWVADGRIGLAAVAVSLAILAFSGMVAGKGLFCALLKTAPLQWAGTVSYSFYLWHLIVIAIVKRALAAGGLGAFLGHWSQIVLLAVCLPASCAVAHASMCLVEQRFGAWLKRQRMHVLARQVMPEPALTAVA